MEKQSQKWWEFVFRIMFGGMCSNRWYLEGFTNIYIT
jgi:hypothetical protein